MGACVGPQLPLLARSRHFEGYAKASAITPKADISTAKSEKQTLDVRFAPESGRKWRWRWRSVVDPQETFAKTKSGRLEAALKRHRRPTYTRGRNG